jgi:hypothetical protein
MKSFIAIKFVILAVSVTVRKIESKVLPESQKIYVSIATTIRFLLGPKNYILYESAEVGTPIN